MSFLRFCKSFCFNFFLALTLVLSLSSCSVEEPVEDGASGSNVSSLNSTGSSATRSYDTKLSWGVSTTREDGSALAVNEVAGYRVYYGVDSGNYTDTIEVEGALVQGLDVKDIPAGEYYFTLTVLDAEGRESDYSNELSISL